MLKGQPKQSGHSMSLVLAWCGAPAGMKTTSPRNCTIAQPWTPYSWWRRFLSDRSRYQLWSWMGSWSTGFSWPCSSATWESHKTRGIVMYQSDWTVKLYLWYSIKTCARTCTMCSDRRVTQWKFGSLLRPLSRFQHFSGPTGFTDTLQTWIWKMQVNPNWQWQVKQLMFTLGTTVIHGTSVVTLLKLERDCGEGCEETAQGPMALNWRRAGSD